MIYCLPCRQSRLWLDTVKLYTTGIIETSVAEDDPDHDYNNDEDDYDSEGIISMK